MKELYLIFNIGCIECGITSDVVGVFNDKERAEKILEQLQNSKDACWRHDGQNEYEMFTITELNTINNDYIGYLTFDIID